MLKKYLQIMGLSSVPQMKELREKFLQKCFDCHPDKGGTDDQFQELLEAKNAISQFILDNIPEDLVDNDEALARRESAEVNIVKFNKICISIKFPSKYSEIYDICLQRRYAEPIDKSDAFNGKKYTVSEEIFITNIINLKKHSVPSLFRERAIYLNL